MCLTYLREDLCRILKTILGGNDRLTSECHPAETVSGRLVGKEAVRDTGPVNGWLESRWTHCGATLLRSLGVMGVVFIAAQPMAWGATYYVRADGSAANKSLATGCTSPASAMDMSTLNGESFFPGDRIVLCSEGGVFRGQFGNTSNGAAGSPITYDGRGSAVISGSDLVHGWAPAGGNVWVANLSAQPQQVFINGTFGNRKTGLGELTGHLDWFWVANQLHLFSSSGDPDVQFQGPGVEAGVRSPVVLLRGEHIVIKGITARHSNRLGIGAWNPPSHVTIKNCVAEWNWVTGIGQEGNSLYEDFTIEDNIARYNGIGGIGFSGPSRNSIIRRNTVYENGKYRSEVNRDNFAWGIKLWEPNGIQEGHEIYENLIYDNGEGLASHRGGHGVGVWLDTIQATPSNPTTIRHNLIYDNKGNGIFMEISSNTVVHGNVLHNNATNASGEPGGVVIDSRINFSSDHNLISNNTIHGGRNGIRVDTYYQSSGCSISNNTIINNIVVGQSDRVLYADGGGNNVGPYGSGNVYDNNCFGAEFDNFIRWGNLSHLHDTYDSWEAEHGESWAQVEGDPQLAGTSMHSLYLAAGSPCRDAGVNLGPIYDDALLETAGWVDSVETSDQDWYGGGWDVGAYLYSGFNPILFADGFESGDTIEWTVTLF